MVTAVTFPVAFLPFLASTGYCGILWDLGCRSTPRTVSVFFFRLSIGEGLPFCHGQPFFLISPGFWSGRKLAFKSPGPQNGPRCRWRWVEIWVSKDHFSVEKNVFCFVRLSYPEAKQKLANSFQLRKTLTRIRMYGGCRWISILVFRNGIKKGWTMVYLYIYIIIKKSQCLWKRMLFDDFCWSYPLSKNHQVFFATLIQSRHHLTCRAAECPEVLAPNETRAPKSHSPTMEILSDDEARV